MTAEFSNDPKRVETRMTMAIFPANANHFGTLFGGQAMAWMDQAAFICATRWCRAKVVTAHSGAIDFLHAVPVGTIVEVIANLVKVGRTSMTVHVSIWIEPMDHADRTLAFEGDFVMVAVDEDNKPLAVPQMPPPETP